MKGHKAASGRTSQRRTPGGCRFHPRAWGAPAAGPGRPRDPGWMAERPQEWHAATARKLTGTATRWTFLGARRPSQQHLQAAPPSGHSAPLNPFTHPPSIAHGTTRAG